MRKKNKVFIFIILIFIFVISIFYIYKILNRQKLNNELTASDIIKLLSYVPYHVILTNNYGNAYQEKIVTNKDLLPLIVSPLFVSDKIDKYDNDDSIIKNNPTDSGHIYKIKDINKYLFNRYNLNINDIPKNSIVNITKFDNKYVIISYNTTNNFSFEFVYKVVINIEETSSDNSKIIIPEKTIFYQLKDNKYYVYKNTDIENQENIIKIYNKIDEFGNELSYTDISEKIKEDFQDYNYVFKHTFKKNRYGYYYYSTELIEEK